MRARTFHLQSTRRVLCWVFDIQFSRSVQRLIGMLSVLVALMEAEGLYGTSGQEAGEA